MSPNMWDLVDGDSFQFPIIWLSAENYTPAYNVPTVWWKEVFLLDGFKVLGTEMAKKYDLTQLHETYSL